MLLLHHAYLSGNLTRFIEILHSNSASASTKKKQSQAIDVNQLDLLGRTVLHLAASDGNIEFVEALLEQSSLKVNQPDLESGWTALHRSLYSGHIDVAQALLNQGSVHNASFRTSIKAVDYEANTPFDVYNSTVSGVNPESHDFVRGSTDLFTFGSNSNHTLGFSDSDDRAFPERVSIKQPKLRDDRFRRVRIRDVSMAKYHTLVCTDEPRENLYVCGFSKEGRLGIPGGTRFMLEPIPMAHHVVAAVAAQDHSLALTSEGEVYSWGSQLSGQLGFDTDIRSSEPSPKRVLNLNREKILGISASLIHSVCFSETSLFTWGTNEGQLGHDKTDGQEKLIKLPRRVASVSGTVRQVSATRYATACLMATQDVLVLTNYGQFRLNLQMERFSNQMTVFRPSRAYAPTKIVKISSGTKTIVAMTNMGDVFDFVLDESTSSIKVASLAKSIKPGRVWSLRKKFMAIRDVAVGQEGSIIMCTESGSVVVGEKKASKRNETKGDYRFTPIPGLTRVVQVRAGTQGAYAVIRNDVVLPELEIDATNLAEDLMCTLPYADQIIEEEEIQLPDSPDPDEDEQDEVLPKHVQNTLKLFNETDLTFEAVDGHDLTFKLGSHTFTAHKAICYARSPALRRLFDGRTVDHLSLVADDTLIVELPISIRPVAFLITMHWIYTDIIIATWLHGNQAQRDQTIRSQVILLAQTLELELLLQAIEKSYAIKTVASLAKHMKLLQSGSQLCDTRLVLADGEIQTFSVVLAARSEFFDAITSGAWLNDRRSGSHRDLVDIKLEHISLQVMQLVLQHIFADEDESIFAQIDLATVEDLLDLVTSVLSAATELILPRLRQVCQRILAKHIHRKNISTILQISDLYNADELKQVCLEYCARNLQYLIGNGFLHGLSNAQLRELSRYISGKQLERLPVSKSGRLLSELVLRNPDILEDTEVIRQDYLSGLLVAVSDGINAKSPMIVPQSPMIKSTPMEDNSLIFEMDECDLNKVAEKPISAPFTPAKPQSKGWAVIPPISSPNPLNLVSSLPKQQPSAAATPIRTPQSARKKGKTPETRETVAIARSPGTPWAASVTQTPVSLSAISQAQASDRSSPKVISPSVNPRRPSTGVISGSLGRPSSYGRSYIGTSASPAQGLSLAQIIAAEEDEKTKIAEFVAKRSMIEIQEAEAAAKKASEFEKWFAEESRRIQQQEAQASKGTKKKPKKKQKDKTTAKPQQPIPPASLQPTALEFRPRNT